MKFNFQLYSEKSVQDEILQQQNKIFSLKLWNTSQYAFKLTVSFLCERTWNKLWYALNFFSEFNFSNAYQTCTLILWCWFILLNNSNKWVECVSKFRIRGIRNIQIVRVCNSEDTTVENAHWVSNEFVVFHIQFLTENSKFWSLCIILPLKLYLNSKNLQMSTKHTYKICFKMRNINSFSLEVIFTKSTAQCMAHCYFFLSMNHWS